MLRFLADIHISPRTVKALQSEGHDIVHITGFLPATETDRRIVEFAAEEGHVIVTQNLDFSALVVKRGKSKPSVLSFRVSNAKPDHITEVLKSVLVTVSKELEKGAIISVDDRGVRIRLLPIKDIL